MKKLMLPRVFGVFGVFAVLLILLSGFAYAGDLKVYEAKCFKDGSAEITVKSNLENKKIYTKDINFSADYLTWYGTVEKKFDLTGKWEDGQEYLRAGVDRQKEYATFITNEAFFRDSGDYLINVNYLSWDNQTKYTNLKFSCAGMIFSCTLVNIEIEECKTIDNRKFEAVLDIRGINQSEIGKLDLYNDLEYVLKAKNKYEDIKGKLSETGSFPKGFSMIEKNDKYYLSYDFDDNFVYSFVAKFLRLDECRNTKNYPNISLYSYKECDLLESRKEYANESVNKDMNAGVKEETAVKNENATIKQNKSISTEKEAVEKVIAKRTEKSNSRIIIGILIAIIIALIVIIIVLQKQKANKWWIK